MTIIRPNKNKNPWNKIVFVLGSMTVASLLSGIFIYSRLANLRYEVISLERNIEENRIVNAELKSELSKITDPDSLEKLAAEKGLIKDRNPQWVFAVR